MNKFDLNILKTTRSPADMVGLFDPVNKIWSLHMTTAKVRLHRQPQYNFRASL